MGIKLLHLADIHLGYYNERLGLTKEDFINSFNYAINFALNPTNKVNAVLIAGDLFHTYAPSSKMVSTVKSKFKMLTDAHIPVILIPGTHDGYGYKNSVYRTETFNGVLVLKSPDFGSPITTDIAGTSVIFYGMAYAPGSTGDPFKTLNKTDNKGLHIALVHGSIEGSPEWEIRKKDLPVKLDTLKNAGMDYIAMGHYHTFSEYTAGKTKVVYPGTLQGMKFGEEGPKLLVTVRFEDSIPIVKKNPIPSKILEQEKVDLASIKAENEDQLIEHLKTFVDKNKIMRFILEGIADFPLDIDYLNPQISDSFAYVELKDKTTIYDSNFVKRVEKDRTILGEFVRRVQEKYNKAESTEQRELLEHALKLVIKKFQD
ncbi:DNA repair exonuclease [bacterium]|nr:DNA repair exonuclease [bacterium]